MQKFTKIVINGREYDSIDSMPPDVRRQYLELMGTLGEDANRDGVPDVLQKPGSSNVIVKESIEFNGREYSSREELPRDVRELLDRMPPSRAEDDATTVELTTEQIHYPKTFVSTEWDSDRKNLPSVTVRLPWLLVLLLVVTVIVLVVLWFSGVKPEQLFGR